jgi:hypothetical protein
MDGWTVAWLVWLASFVVIEGAAFASGKTGASLSDHVWSWFRIRQGWRRPAVAVPRGVLVLFLAWLLVHLSFGWLST